MKKLFLVFMFLYLGLICINAQVFDLNTKWYYCVYDWPTSPGKCITRELKNTITKNDTLVSEFSLFGFPATVIKQLGNKVWFDNELIYNFDLRVGDTLNINQFGRFETYTLDSIHSKSIFNKNRRIQFFSEKSSLSIKICIEGIGTSFFRKDISNHIDLINPFSMLHVLEIKKLWASGPNPLLSNIKINDEVMYINIEMCDYCEKLLSTSIMKTDKFEIFPNPSSDYLQIKVDNSFPSNNYQIFDQFGKLVIVNKIDDKSNKIYIGDLKNGVYFIKISDNANSKSQMKRFIKL